MPNNPLNVKLNKNWLLLIISIFCAAVIIAATSFFSPMRPNHTVVQDIEHLVDTKKQYSISNILSISDNVWQQQNQDLTSLDMSNELHWFKFTLNNLDPSQSWLLEIDYALLDSINLWFVQDNKVLAEYMVGDSLIFAQRAVDHENFLFPLPTNVQPVEVYLNAYSKGMMRLPLNIWQQQDYLGFASKNGLIMGGFLGLMLAMGLSNLLFFITTRSPTFLVYAGYVIFLALTLSTLQGIGYRYIWSNSPWFQQHAIGIFANLTVCLSIIFCDLLLNVRAYSTRLSKILKMSAFAFLLGLVISLFISLQVFIKVFLLMFCASGVLLLAVAIWLWVKGLAIAGYYTLAWAILIVSGFVLSLDALNIVNFNMPSYYLLMIGAAIETVLLALILAISHDQQRQTLLDTQAELLNQERQVQHAQKDMLALQENATEDLEYKVQERTLELEIALRELSETNRELQQKNTLDALTGIRNRSYFDKKYQAEVRRSRREQTQLSVVMMDIDHFKNVNDQYGHLVGDECIRAVAHTLEKALKRPSDDVCRYGGEEFALILPSTNLEGALTLVEQLRNEIEKTTIQAENVSVNITISAGIGTAIADLNQAEDIILALADRQLYAAKNAGRNNVQGSYLDAIQQ
ncbi:sensor domain-containing diguanylate cyclase [Paraglaciecola arctica]|uniref:diguanylate cyclase n=1 Tax=Paraglaciecola arctica BSs20135 TaxID=493475 RepID=K6ZEM0_9ALTE|nr:diguanylate cyclase [Paraglaciecola arctica]GAC21850.1 diguanylate cyclase [Paraglaciecola arctica BSs20135]